MIQVGCATNTTKTTQATQATPTAESKGKRQIGNQIGTVSLSNGPTDITALDHLQNSPLHISQTIYGQNSATQYLRRPVLPTPSKHIVSNDQEPQPQQQNEVKTNA